jgi:hypothetical protein
MLFYVGIYMDSQRWTPMLSMHNIGQRTFRGTPLNFLSRSSAIFSILGAILIRFGDFK